MRALRILLLAVLTLLPLPMVAETTTTGIVADATKAVASHTDVQVGA